MKTNTGLFYNFYKTFSSLDYYRQFHRVPLKLSIKMFVLYFLIISMIVTAVYTIKYEPLANLCKALPAALQDAYPDGLEITISNGEVSTNSYEPLFLKMGLSKKILGNVSEAFFGDGYNVNNISAVLEQQGMRIYTAEEFAEMRDEIQRQAEEPLYFNFIAIDTKATIENFEEYESLALLTQNDLITIDENNSLKAHSLAQVQDYIIEKYIYDEWIESAKPLLNNAIWAIMISVFLISLIYYMIGYPIYLFILALILFLITKLISYPRSYKQAYQIGLHLVMITGSVFTLLHLIGLSISIPFIETAALCIMGTITLISIELETTIVEKSTGEQKNPMQLRREALYRISDLVEIQNVLRHNTDLLKGFDGDSPLLHYSEQGNQGIVLFILKMGADVHFTNSNGETALHVAAREGHYNVINVLLDHNAKIDAQTPRGAQPIHYASVFGHKNLAKHIASRGATIDFITAVSLGDVDKVKQLINENKDYVNLYSPAIGCNPLHCAVMERNYPMVELLLENGALPDATDEEQLTPLIYAVRVGEVNIIKNLLHKGANKTLKDGLGHDAAWWARQIGNLEIMQLLGAT